MKTAGIIAEYNPFHNGHKYLVDYVRKKGADCVVAVISGNFVQRGQAAIFDEWIRTRAALQNGVDLVIELPAAYSIAPAADFAYGGVMLLEALGCVDTLAFGSECGSTELLTQAAGALESEQLDALIKNELATGKTYARARSDAVGGMFSSKLVAAFTTPNDILAIEYIRAKTVLKSSMTPLAVKRRGAEHDKEHTAFGIASASHIRSLIQNGGDYSRFVPENAYRLYRGAIHRKQAPNCLENGERALLWQLRKLSADDFARLSDASGEGLHNRIFKAVRNGGTLDEIYELAKTKRYTHARIRRLVLAAALGIFDCSPPEYIRVLGFGRNGEKLLGKLKKTAQLPLVTSYSQAANLSDAAKAQYEREAKYTDLYTLLMPEPASCGAAMTKAVININKDEQEQKK